MNRSQTYLDRVILSDIIDTNLNAKTIGGNFREVGRFLSGYSGGSRSIEGFARMVGGVLCEGDLDPTADAEFLHDLGETPTMILIARSLDGLGSEVFGHPNGGAAPLNQALWTPTKIYLRAPRAARYSVVIV